MEEVCGWRWVWGVVLFCAVTATASRAQDFTTLHSFDAFKGSSPEIMVLVQGADGNFFGTTFQGGFHQTSRCAPAKGCGTMFAITPAGEFAVLYNFCSQTNCTDGEAPESSLVQATSGDLYGTTDGGGNYFSGTVFKITAGRELTTV